MKVCKRIYPSVNVIQVAVLVLIGTICQFGLVGAESTVDHCAQTSNEMLKSCRQGAESDYSLALAKCQNLPGFADCKGQADDERQDALSTCNDEFDVRQDACKKLGPAAYNPAIDPSRFTTRIDNPYFPLVPGTTFIYEGETEDGTEHDEFAVTHKTRVIAGVRCVQVHDTVRIDDELTEDTFDWFAQDLDGNVWYFGENTHELENGLITTIDGSFQSGVDQAKPGIIMEAHPRVGDFYPQEFDLGNAEDFAEVTGLNATVTVPVGTFQKCLKTRETTPLEPELTEDKYYAAGVGNILTVDHVTGEKVKLIQVKKNQ